MEHWLENEWGARLVTWAQPTEEGEVYEVVTSEGELVRADSLPLLVAALAAGRPALALVA